MLFGRTPVDEVSPSSTRSSPGPASTACPPSRPMRSWAAPTSYSRLGRFDEAREMLERSKAICRELGIPYGLAEAHMAGAEMEMLAGDPDAGRTGAARRDPRRDGDGRVALRRPLPHPARPRPRRPGARRGRPRRARGGTRGLRRRAEVEGGPRAGARTPRSDGGGGRPRPRCRRFMAGNDDITARAEILCRPRRGAPRTRRPAGAAGALAEALALHEEKGNLVAAEHCHRLSARIFRPRRAGDAARRDPSLGLTSRTSPRSPSPPPARISRQRGVTGRARGPRGTP